MLKVLFSTSAGTFFSINSLKVNGVTIILMAKLILHWKLVVPFINLKSQAAAMKSVLVYRCLITLFVAKYELWLASSKWHSSDWTVYKHFHKRTYRVNFELLLFLIVEELQSSNVHVTFLGIVVYCLLSSWWDPLFELSRSSLYHHSVLIRHMLEQFLA